MKTSLKLEQERNWIMTAFFFLMSKTKWIKVSPGYCTELQ